MSGGWFRMAWVLTTLLCAPTLVSSGMALVWGLLSLLLLAEALAPKRRKAPSLSPGPSPERSRQN